MATSPTTEPFRGLLLRYRGRTGLTQRDLAVRMGAGRRTLQAWEAGVKYPSADGLRALIAALLGAGGLTAGREAAEAQELWAAALQEAPRMHAPFDPVWFAGLLTSRAAPPPAPVGDVLGDAGAAAAHRAGADEPSQDWGEAPDTLGFVGRAEELTLLRRWVLDERCRLVAVLGFGGIGKTILAARVAQDVTPSFERVYWRSLRNAPPVGDWLAGAIGFLSDQQLLPPPAESARITALLQLLRARRCLLVLDNSETLFEPGQREGRYRAGMEGYGRVLQAVGESAHQSCLTVTSREAPPELAVLGGGTRALELHGLGPTEAHVLLADKQLDGDEQAWIMLVERYGGNGLALKIVGETIRQVFDGDVAAFLRDAAATYGTVIGGIRRLLDAQVERLSPIERDVLTRLAIEREPISLTELARDMAPSGGRSAVVEAIETLRRRSLVERGERGATFMLQAMVLEYMTDRLVETVAAEIERGQPRLLAEQPLIEAQAKEFVRQAQERLIGAPILQRLNAQDAGAGAARSLLALLAAWRDRPAAEQGYGPGNVVNLLRLLRRDLRGMDLSRLVLRQVYLQGVDAQDASLAGTHLSEAVLAEAFGYPTAVALSADGALLAAGTPTGEVHLWRAADRTPLLTVQGHTAATWGVAFSRDRALVASSGVDGLVRLWETATGRLLNTLQGHTGGIRGLALSADGRLVASGSVDGTIRLWDSASSQLLATLLGHSGAVWGVALSGDGRLVASGGDDGVIRLWEAASGQLLASMEGHTGLIWALALSSDGRMLVSGGADGTVRLWDSGNGQLLATLLGHTAMVQAVALTGDGRLAASAAHDGTVRLWEAGSAQLLATMQGHTGAVFSVALSGDGRLVASGGEDGTVSLSEVATGQRLAALRGRTGVVWGVALSGDGRLLASGSDDGTLRVWEVGSGHLLATLRGHIGAVWDAALSGDGRLVASGGDDSMLRLWDSGSGQLLATLRGHGGVLWGVALSGDGRLVASSGDDGTVRVWDAKSGDLLATLQGHTGAVWGVALSGDGRLLVSGGFDALVKLWEVPGGRLLATLQGHTGGVRGVALSGDGRLAASSSLDGTVRVWEMPLGRLVATLRGHAAAVWGVALSGDGRLVASSSWDGTARLWEAGSGQLLATLQGHAGAVWGVAFSEDGRLVASGGDDGTVRLWETGSGVCLRTLRSDRHYQRLDITGLTGITEAQRIALLALGAVEQGPRSSSSPAAAG